MARRPAPPQPQPANLTVEQLHQGIDRLLSRLILHVALALTTGLLCGVVASRVGGRIAPPYAAILGTIVAYPMLVVIWGRLPVPARFRR